MECQKCGKIIENSSKFCPFCGEQQSQMAVLVNRAMNGEEDAVTELYARTVESVYFTVKVMIREEDTVNDIVQDSYIKGFRNLNQLKDADSFQAWMKRIAHNRAVDWLRRNRKVAYVQEFLPMEELEVQERMEERGENLPEIAMEQKEVARLLKEILDVLPDDQRMVISMFYYDQMGVKEIAEELEISENTVKSRLNYGRKKVEMQVRELEKKGTKLYSLAPIPFLLVLLRTAEEKAWEIPASSVFQAVKAASVKTAAAGSASVAGKAARTSVGKVAAGETAKTAAVGAAKAGAGVAMKVAAAKGLAVVLSIAVVGGGAVGGVKLGQLYLEKQETLAQKEENPAESVVAEEPTKTDVTEAPPEVTPEPELSEDEQDMVAYAAVLGKYAAAQRGHWDWERSCEEGFPIVYTIVDFSVDGGDMGDQLKGDGFAFTDLNQDGIRELAIVDPDDSNVLVELYTLKNGEPYRINEIDLMPARRFTYRICEGGAIQQTNIPGAYLGCFLYYTLNENGDGLKFKELLDNDAYHTYEWSDEEELFSGNWLYSDDITAGQDGLIKISKEEADAIRAKYVPASLDIIPFTDLVDLTLPGYAETEGTSAEESVEDEYFGSIRCKGKEKAEDVADVLIHSMFGVESMRKLFEVYPQQFMDQLEANLGQNGVEEMIVKEDLNIMQKMENMNDGLRAEGTFPHEILESEDIAGDELEEIREVHRQLGMEISAAKRVKISVAEGMSEDAEKQYLYVQTVQSEGLWYLNYDKIVEPA